MERLESKVKVLGFNSLPASPAGELLAYLLKAPRSLETVRSLGIPLAAALEVLENHSLGQGLQIQGQSLEWVGESDLQEYWLAVDKGDFDAAWWLYGFLLPGIQSPLSKWMEWLQAERKAMLAALLELTLLYPQQADALARAELSNPKDQTRALAACLLQAEVFLRKGEGKPAVLILGKALGLQEYMAQEFSGLSLALLAEAQALWGHPRKAQETALKALERSSAPYTQSRAHFALYRARRNPDDLSASLDEARAYPQWLAYLQTIN